MVSGVVCAEVSQTTPGRPHVQPEDRFEMERSSLSPALQSLLALQGTAFRPWAALLRLFARVGEWHRIRTEIADLRSLDDRILRDIGIHSGDLEAAVRSGYRSSEDRFRRI
jgi:uncharacterized protein YjiS (DUF1127 family)